MCQRERNTHTQVRAQMCEMPNRHEVAISQPINSSYTSSLLLFSLKMDIFSIRVSRHPKEQRVFSSSASLFSYYSPVFRGVGFLYGSLKLARVTYFATTLTMKSILLIWDAKRYPASFMFLVFNHVTCRLREGSFHLEDKIYEWNAMSQCNKSTSNMCF